MSLVEKRKLMYYKRYGVFLLTRNYGYYLSHFIFFTGGYFLYVIAFIFKIDWLYTVATSYVFAIGIANPIIPIIPMTIALTITIYKVIGAKKKR